ncbi:hypothetical protein VTK26DRAFT_6275 [Humicola hyalothermophila]
MKNAIGLWNLSSLCGRGFRRIGCGLKADNDLSDLIRAKHRLVSPCSIAILHGFLQGRRVGGHSEPLYRRLSITLLLSMFTHGGADRLGRACGEHSVLGAAVRVPHDTATEPKASRTRLYPNLFLIRTLAPGISWDLYWLGETRDCAQGARDQKSTRFSRTNKRGPLRSKNGPWSLVEFSMARFHEPARWNHGWPRPGVRGHMVTSYPLT